MDHGLIAFAAIYGFCLGYMLYRSESEGAASPVDPPEYWQSKYWPLTSKKEDQ